VVSKLEAVPEILGCNAWGLAEKRQGEVGWRRGGMVELWGRAGRRNGRRCPPHRAGAGGAAEAGGEGEGEGRWRRRAGRERAAAGRRREVVEEESEGENAGAAGGWFRKNVSRRSSVKITAISNFSFFVFN
jgi:hypothetical protein